MTWVKKKKVCKLGCVWSGSVMIKHKQSSYFPCWCFTLHSITNNVTQDTLILLREPQKRQHHLLMGRGKSMCVSGWQKEWKAMRNVLQKVLPGEWEGTESLKSLLSSAQWGVIWDTQAEISDPQLLSLSWCSLFSVLFLLLFTKSNLCVLPPVVWLFLMTCARIFCQIFMLPPCLSYRSVFQC